ncbi:DUF1484 family protein [Cupriavidus sp. WKF15]|uniref:DUF1484 family protein n=1 Tax=Cupriavidus sp. WKF15 TaxID=3032282 RepID=UPI0023E247CC|nr:DUF1484 family protein [Cupriavidus sp. WKF15]WER45678.1 DUF1484 family protein [Cupriavidus sp. WKF15]
MSTIDVSAANSSLQQVSAGLEGVLDLLEQQSERSEKCFSAFCLLGLLKAQLEWVLACQMSGQE